MQGETVSFRTYNPLRKGSRKPLNKARPEERKESWRSGVVRETAAGIRELRVAAFRRSSGLCECWMETDRKPCGKAIFWSSFHLHHLGPRIARSDVLEKVAATHPDCHDEITGKLQWRKRA